MENLKSLNVLLIEDNKLSAIALCMVIKSNIKIDQLEIKAIQSIDQMNGIFNSNSGQPHLVILSEPGYGKMNFEQDIPSHINQIKAQSPDSEVIIHSYPSKLEAAIKSFRSGAYDVVLKDEYAEMNMVNSIKRYLNRYAVSNAPKKQFELV